MPVFGVFLVLIFTRLNWIMLFVEQIFVFNPNTGICGPQNFRIQIPFTQWPLETASFANIKVDLYSAIVIFLNNEHLYFNKTQIHPDFKYTIEYTRKQ